MSEATWAALGDDDLLTIRMCDLGLSIEGTELEPRIATLGAELDARGLKFRPHFWLSDEWFTPDGVPGVAIPFYLAHPRLARLELSQMLEVEGGDPDECLRILRHEAGHAIDNAYQLRSRPTRRRLFGLPTTPYPEYYRIDNRIMTTPQGTGPRKIYINREPGSNQITFWGNMPQDDAGAGESLAIEDPADFTAKLFRELLEQRGVTVYGRPRTRHTELASMQTFSVTTIASGGGGESGSHSNPVPLVLANHQSQPLADDLRVINKVSQNLHAELMLRLLGKEKGTSGSIAGGLEVLRGFLTSAGIKPDQFAFYDGSGLSRENLVSPAAVVELLQYAEQQPWGKLYEDTLPVAGVDGSLNDRLKTAPVKGTVHGKTGSLGHVNALSGYATTAKGERVAFSILCNNHNLSNRKAIETIDQIVEKIVADGT